MNFGNQNPAECLIPQSGVLNLYEMKAYLVIEGEHYESSGIVKAFFDKIKAIEFMNKYVEDENVKRQPNDRFRYKLADDGFSWDNPIGYIKIQEIDIE